MNRYALVLVALLFLLAPVPASANNVSSSTLWFQGTLTDDGDGSYTGNIPMIAGYYYVPGGPGAAISEDGGFDILAKTGAQAYLSCFMPTSVVIADDHDAFGELGVWDEWRDPDHADYNYYTLTFYGNHWYLEYTAADDLDRIPMSGVMHWDAMYAEETGCGGNVGPVHDNGPAAHGGGPGAWDYDWNWGVEVVPLEMRGFGVEIADLGGGIWEVSLTPRANTVRSSTMEFEGDLIDVGGGIYTGTIAMTAGSHYVTGGDGGHIHTGGGFDLYARAGATAFIQGNESESYTIGPDHDACSPSGPWGPWTDPDHADWSQYSLELTAGHWHLRYTATGESPMSGPMNWGAGYAEESDLGTQDGVHGGSAAHGGGARAWDWDCGWGVEVIPLEQPGFDVTFTPTGQDGFQVIMSPGASATLDLVPDFPCYTTADTLIVNIDMTTMGSAAILGGQFFLQYDNTLLDFLSADPGDAPFTRQIYEAVDAGAGTIDYAVGLENGGSGTIADTTMARLTFSLLDEGCLEESLVWFRAHVPETRFSDENAQPVVPATADMTAVTIDETAPVITGFPGNAGYQCAGDVPGADIGLVTATDNCGTPTITHEGDSSSGSGCPADPLVILRTYRATDDCGNYVEQVQTITVSDTVNPVIAGCPSDIMVSADAGDCSAVVDWTAPTASDNCSLASFVSSHSPGDTFSGSTTVVYTATDACGNTSTCTFDVTVIAVNEMVVDLVLFGNMVSPLTRCIVFKLRDCDTMSLVRVKQEITFINGLASNVTVPVPCGNYTCVAVRGRRHTLRRTLDASDGFGISGTRYVADFITPAGKELVGGDLNADHVVDIVDFGILMAAWGTVYPTGDTDCTTPYLHADLDGNGVVFTEDFTFIQIHFLQWSEHNCCIAFDAGMPPVDLITVEDLKKRGMNELTVADLNGDGVLDSKDMAAFARGVRP